MSKAITPKTTSDDLYVVGVGASAGGLDALSKMLSAFNGPKSEFCVVVVMHLSPDYKSELASILGKRCKWPVESVTSNLEMEARHIYVTPQNKDIHIEGNMLILDSLPANYSSAPSIDTFFYSLAKSKGKHALGIVLSGYGKDGSKGISEIRDHKGFTIAQLPETAEHKDMPFSAVQTGQVDAILPVEQMFDEINQYIINIKTISQSRMGPKSIDSIFDLLEKRSGTDFSLYKPTTIMRRINYRIEKLGLKSLADYYSMIKNSPKELDILFETVLIGVTQFFRDPEAVTSLKKTLVQYLEDKKPGDSIRIWSVGCATGEEPYTIIILLHEILQANISKYQIQVFASDIDERALNFARQGIYKKETLENVSGEYLERYFEKRNGNQYQIKKAIKQFALFTRHDISHDPPFVRLDLVCCRNLLIYFNNNLQKQTFQIFHYSLRPKGLLFLGKSESTSVAANLFDKVTSKKVFRKAEAALDYDLRFSRFKAITERPQLDGRKTHRNNMTIVDVAKETLYYKFEHPFTLINEQAEIKEVNGSLRLYLEIGEGTMNANLYKMANKEFVTVIKAVLSQVKRTGVPHVSHTIKFNLYDQDHFVKIRIAPLIYEVNDLQYYIVIFQKIEPSEHILDLEKKLSASDFVDLRVRELEDELEATKEHLQIFTEELEANNEELQTINEELQSANEELKSSNEELETGNEELQSANEELNTANNELRLTNEMLIEKEKELQEERETSLKNEFIYRAIANNIPNGTVGILNDKFEVAFLSGKILEEYPDAHDGIGKSMPDTNPDPIEKIRLRKLCEETLNGNPGTIRVRYYDRYFSVRTTLIDLPGQGGKSILYLTQDVTEEKKNEVKLSTTLEAAKLIVFEYDFLNDLVVPNEALSKLMNVKNGKPLKISNFLNIIHPDDIKKIKKQFRKALETGELDTEFRIVKGEQIMYYRVIGKLLFDNANNPERGIGSIIDVTQDKEMYFKILESEEQFKRIADAAPMIIWKNNIDHQTTFINKAWYQYTGGTKEESLGRGWVNFIHPHDQEKVQTAHLKAYKKREDVEVQYRIRNKNGDYRWFLNYARPYNGFNNEFEGYIGSITDITNEKLFSDKLEEEVAIKTLELKNSNDELVKMNMSLEEYAYVASHDLQEPVRKIQTFNSILISNKDNPEEVQKYSTKIKESANRMTALIQDILSYSMLTKGTARIELIDLDVLLNDIKTDLEFLINDENVKIVAKNLGKAPGVRTFLNQLFLNLIKNGIKYNNNANPEIVITAEEVTSNDLPKKFKDQGSGKFKMICFADNGIGINKNQYENIFKLFKRLHSKSEYSGTGIGLSICKRVVELHKGYIDVKSTIGEGTTFTVYLPLRG